MAQAGPGARKARPGLFHFVRRLGPGLITGASDDDPSGIATYSQIGAQFGYGLLWTMVLAYPLMSAIQEISARLGRVTGQGIAASLRKIYPGWVGGTIVTAVAMANVINLGADIAGMGAAVHLLIPGPAALYGALLTLLSLALQVFLPYTRYVNILKWMTLALFAYVAALFVVPVPVPQVLLHMVVPEISFSRQFLVSCVAVLGTTISPYLFFWQASQEVEEVQTTAGEEPLRKAPRQAPRQISRIKFDTYLGMAFSNIISLCIIITTGSTLFHSGTTHIDSAAQAAEALRPLAGRFAYELFSMGIIGTGLLALPVLAGSLAYAVGETFDWRTGLQKTPRQAPGFYAALAGAMLLGLGLDFAGIDPISALFWSAVINGLVAVPVMVFMMLIASNRRIMGQFILKPPLRVVGWLATAVMLAAAVGLVATLGGG